MAIVRVPAPMRDAVGGLAAVEVEGATLEAVLRNLVGRYPAARERLLRPDGTLNPHLMVVVDGTEAESRFTPVAPESEIVIIPALGGGRPAPTSRDTSGGRYRSR